MGGPCFASTIILKSSPPKSFPLLVGVDEMAIADAAVIANDITCPLPASLEWLEAELREPSSVRINKIRVTFLQNRKSSDDYCH